MEIKDALLVFDTLSQETRLKAFRQLIKAGPEGVSAGQLAAALDVPHNTLSFHLSHLTHAGLISARKAGRSIIYSANFESVRALIEFIVRDCCSAGVANIRQDKDSGCSIIELESCCPDARSR